MAFGVFEEDAFEEDTYIYMWVLPSDKAPVGYPLLLRRPEPRLAPFEDWFRIGGVIRRPISEEVATQLFIRREFLQEMRLYTHVVKRIEEALRVEGPVYTEEFYRRVAEVYDKVIEVLEEDEVS